MEDIARASMEDPQKAVPYIVTEVFAELINIVNKDSSKLTPPSEKQIEICDFVCFATHIKTVCHCKLIQFGH